MSCFFDKSFKLLELHFENTHIILKIFFIPVFN